MARHLPSVPTLLAMQLSVATSMRDIGEQGRIQLLGQDAYITYEFEGRGVICPNLAPHPYEGLDAIAAAERLMLEEDCIGFVLESDALGQRLRETGEFDDLHRPQLYQRGDRIWHVF